MYKDLSTEEIIYKVRSSNEAAFFVELLNRITEDVSDIRNKTTYLDEDNLEIRSSSIKIIENKLITPLTDKQKLTEKHFDDYN